MSARQRKAPAGLSRPARQWWIAMRDEYAINDQAGLRLLTQAAEAWDRAAQAAERVAAEGLVVTDTRGGLRAHPAVRIERDAWAMVLASLKALRLDIVPPRPVGGGRA